MELSVKSQTATTITLQWTSEPGAIGYRFKSSVMEKWSFTFDPTRRTVKFSKADYYEVEAIMPGQRKKHPPAPTPPPPPPPPDPVPVPTAMPKNMSAIRYGGSTGSIDGLTHLEALDVLIISAFKLTPALRTAIMAANPDIKILIYKAASELAISPVAGAGANTGITYGEAQTHDASSAADDKWIIKNPSGQPITPWFGYTDYYGGDPGLQSFQDRWYQNVKASMIALGAHGVFVDNMIASIPTSMQKYPTQPEWEEAIVKFAQPSGAFARLKGDGYLVVPNTHKWVANDPRSNDATFTKEWWTRVAPGATGLFQEYFMQSYQTKDRPRIDGTEWWNNYRKYSQIITLAQSLGVKFFGSTTGLVKGAQEYMGIYGKAAFLLKTDGSEGSCFVWSEAGYVGGDNYNPRIHYSIGVPLGAESEVATSVFRRTFSKGLVVLNAAPVASYSLGSSPDGRTYRYSDDSPVLYPVAVASGRALILKTG